MEEKECSANIDSIIPQIEEKKKCDTECSVFNSTNNSKASCNLVTFLSSDAHDSSINVCRREQHPPSSSAFKSSNALVDLQHPQYSNSGINISTTENAGFKNCELDFERNSGRHDNDAINSLNVTLEDTKKSPLFSASDTPSSSTSLEDFVDGLKSSSCHSNVPSTSAGPKNTARSAKSIEMQHYIDKLKEMVPYAKNAPKLSKVQLIHCAIDYITDLQEALEARVKRRKPNDPNSSACRLPLSNLPVSQQLNSSNISDSPSSASIQFTGQPSSTDDLQRVMSYPPTFEPCVDGPATVQQSANQRVNNSSNNHDAIPKSEELNSKKTNSSPQSFSCIQSINQMFLRSVQEDKLNKCLINKVGKSTPERTNVKISSERESQVNGVRSANETALTNTHNHSDNIEGEEKIRTSINNSVKPLIKKNTSNSETFILNK